VMVINDMLINASTSSESRLRTLPINAAFKEKDVHMDNIAYSLLNNENTSLQNIGRIILRSKTKNSPIIRTTKKNFTEQFDKLLFNINGNLLDVNSLYDLLVYSKRYFVVESLKKIGVEIKDNIVDVALLSNNNITKNINTYLSFGNPDYGNVNADMVLFRSDISIDTDLGLSVGSSYKTDMDKVLFIYAEKSGNMLAIDSNKRHYEINRSGDEINITPLSQIKDENINLSYDDKNIALPFIGEYKGIVLEDNSGEVVVRRGDIKVDNDSGLIYATIDNNENDIYLYNNERNVWYSDNSITNIRRGAHSYSGKSGFMPKLELTNDGKIKRSIPIALSNGNVVVIKKDTKIAVDNSKDIVKFEYQGAIYELDSHTKLWKPTNAIDKKKVLFRSDIDSIIYNKKYIHAKTVDSKVMTKIYDFISTKYGINISHYTQRDIDILYPDFSNETAFVINGEIVINSDKVTLDTPLHEFGHIYISYLKNKDRDMYDRIMSVISQDDRLMSDVMNARPNLSNEEIHDEMFSILLGYSSQGMMYEYSQNSFKNVFNKIKFSLLKFWRDIMSGLFGIKPYDISISEDMSIKQVMDQISKDVIFGDSSILSNFIESDKKLIMNNEVDMEKNINELKIMGLITSIAPNNNLKYKKICS